jgi:hypothetical protein
MNAPFVAPVVFAPIEEVYRARCEARAVLHVNGYLSLHEAVDELQADAERNGLLDLIGQDEAQAIMAYAFCAVDFRDDDLSAACERAIMIGAAELVRRWEAADSKRVPERPTRPAPYRPPQATVDAFKFVARQGDAVALAAWLAAHPLDAPALLKD